MDTPNAQAAESTPSVSLTEEQILAAAVNSPALSPDEFKLGETTFKIVHLPYDDYVQFLGHIQPILEFLVGKKAEKENVSIPGIALTPSLDASSLLRFCSNSLPEMVRLVCKQTQPAITTSEIKASAKTPFALAAIVLQQVSRNEIIKDFASFFAQVTPLFRTAK